MASGLGAELSHADGIRIALARRACIGVTAVGNHAADAALRREQRGLRDTDGASLDVVCGEHTGGGA